MKSKKNFRKYKRSGSEICPICKLPTKLVQHHIKGREIEDANKPYNLTWICPNCHDKIHSNEITILGNFFTSDGYQLIYEFPKSFSKSTPSTN
jgi:uncharacterized protein YlaI